MPKKRAHCSLEDEKETTPEWAEWRILLFCLDGAPTFVHLGQTRSMLDHRTFLIEYPLARETRTVPVALRLDKNKSPQNFYVFAKVEPGEWKLARS